MLILFLVVFVILVLLNAIFVYAEFASVKIRSSQIEELVDQGRRGARLVQHIHANLDEYLSVCQVGITFASVALGFIGEMMAANLLLPLMHGVGGGIVIHTTATIISIVFVSFIHILLGEQVPKLIAIRKTDRAALWSAPFLRISRLIFFIPLWLLNKSSKAVLRMFGYGALAKQEQVSEDELRIILERSQSGGILSFRRLLMMENIFDMGELKVRDSMQPRDQVITLSNGMTWAEIDNITFRHRFSRFPLLLPGNDIPVGSVHIKQIMRIPRDSDTPDLSKIARTILTVNETTPLEQLLSDMQKRQIHVAMVIKENRWIGFLSMEDIIEEIIGTIGDEFEEEVPITLSNVLNRQRIVLSIEGFSIVDAVRKAVSQVPKNELPTTPEIIIRTVAERERLASTYIGKGIAIPHARLSDIKAAVLMIIRSEKGIPVEGASERARLLFLIVTPSGQPRVHQKLLARIAKLLENSEYVEDRLFTAQTPAEMCDVILTGEMTSID